MSRKRVLVAAVAGLLLVVAAAVGLTAYRGHAEADAARSFVERSRPLHKPLEGAISQLASSFVPETFYGANNLVTLQKARTPRQYLRALRDVADYNRESFDAQRFEIREVANALRRVDRAALTEVDEPFLASGSEHVRDAKAIADANRDFIRRTRRFVRNYSATISVLRRESRLTVDYQVAQLQAVAGRVTAVDEAVARLRALARRLRSIARKMRRLRPSSDLRAGLRVRVRSIVTTRREVTLLAAAFQRRDLPAAQAIERRLRRRQRRADRRFAASRASLLTSSRIARELSDIRRRQEAIDARYGDLSSAVAR